MNPVSLTAQQTALLSAFAECREQVENSIVHLARKYKECVDAGIDMKPHCEPALAFRLERIAKGHLLAKSKIELLMLEDKTVEVMATLPKAQQQELWKQGVKIVRNGKIQTVKLTDLRASEARRVVDTTGGIGRVLDPKEQKRRMTVVPQRRDHELAVRLPYETFVDARKFANAQGKSLHQFVLDLVRDYVGASKKKAA